MLWFVAAFVVTALLVAAVLVARSYLADMIALCAIGVRQSAAQGDWREVIGIIVHTLAGCLFIIFLAVYWMGQRGALFLWDAVRWFVSRPGRVLRFFLSR
jgi:hypothetical protein